MRCYCYGFKLSCSCLLKGSQLLAEPDCSATYCAVSFSSEEIGNWFSLFWCRCCELRVQAHSPGNKCFVISFLYQLPWLPLVIWMGRVLFPLRPMPSLPLISFHVYRQIRRQNQISLLPFSMEPSCLGWTYVLVLYLPLRPLSLSPIMITVTCTTDLPQTDKPESSTTVSLVSTSAS